MTLSISSAERGCTGGAGAKSLGCGIGLSGAALTDGNAAATDEDHNAALNNFYLTFGDVMSTDLVIDCLKRNAQVGLAAAE